MNLLQVRDLSFSYGRKPVFSQVALDIAPGELFCLVGPNGCGKSTLLHCILGHLKPQSGAVLIQGRPLSGYSPRELAAQLAYVPQSHTRSFPYRTLDVVAMGQTRSGRSMLAGREQEQGALAVMEELGIAHLAQEPYTTLSGGELQMVMLARALYQDSALLVLDEPAAHLDIRRTQHILNLLLDVSRRRGTAILMSTHDFNHPLQFQDGGAQVKMALMEGGALSMGGAPVDLLTSGYLEKMYQINSQLVQVQGRHFLAAWSQ